MVWEPKETGNFIFEEKKNKLGFVLEQNGKKKNEKTAFFSKICIFL